MNRLKKKMQWQDRMLMIGLAAVVAVLFAAAIVGLIHLDQPAFASLGGSALLPVLGMAAGALTDEEFRKKVLDGTEAIVGKQKEFEKTFDEFQTSTKKDIGELTNVKNTVNDISAKVVAIERAQLALRQERSLFQGDPVRRILASEEKAGMFLCAVLKAAGKPIPSNLEQFGKMLNVGKHGAVIGKTALLESATPGSTMIMTELARDIYDLLSTYGAWSTLNVRTVGTKTTRLPVRTARPTFTWVTTQGTALLEDTAKAGTEVNLDIITGGAMIGVARELIEDAEIDVVGELLNDFAEACGYGLDWSAFSANGDVDGTDGGMTGIFVGGTAAVAANGGTKIGLLKLEDFVRCMTTLPAVASRRPLKWWMHPYTLARICTIQDGNGRSLFHTAMEAPAPGAIGSILGRPVVLADAAPSTDAAGTVVAVLGDPRGCDVGIRKQFEFAASEHFQFSENKVTYRGLIRGGVKIKAATAFAMLKTATS